jgi:hypothetical protein
MKTNIIIIAGLMIGSLSAAFAQDRADTMKTSGGYKSSNYKSSDPKDQQNKEKSDQGKIESTQLPVNSRKWKNEDRVVITTEDVPPRVLVTLQDPKYKGWENSTLYKNRTTDEYMIEIRDGSSAKVYYFSKEGEELKKP